MEEGGRRKEEGESIKIRNVIMNAGIFTEYEIHRLVTETLPSHPSIPQTDSTEDGIIILTIIIYDMINHKPFLTRPFPK